MGIRTAKISLFWIIGYTPGLLNGLKHRDPNVRFCAAEALNGTKDERAVLPLCAALQDAEQSVRRHAAEALGKLSDDRAVEPLCGALRDAESGVCRAAIEALSRIGGKRAVQALVEMLGRIDTNEQGWRAARIPWQCDRQKTISTAASALGRMHAVEAVSCLLGLLSRGLPASGREYGVEWDGFFGHRIDVSRRVESPSIEYLPTGAARQWCTSDVQGVTSLVMGLPDEQVARASVDALKTIVTAAVVDVSAEDLAALAQLTVCLGAYFGNVGGFTSDGPDGSLSCPGSDMFVIEAMDCSGIAQRAEAELKRRAALA